MKDDRDAILARRRRLIALALAGGAVASTASCSVCLTPDAGVPADSGVDAPETPDAPDTGADDTGGSGDGDGG